MKRTIEAEGLSVVVTDDPDFLSECMEQGVPAVGCLLPDGTAPGGLPAGSTLLDMEIEDALCFLRENPQYAKRILCRVTGEPWCPVRTKRLVIRELYMGDGEKLHMLLPQCRQLHMMEKCHSISDCEAWIKAYAAHTYQMWDLGLWGIFLGEMLVGLAGLEPGQQEDALELGYLVDKTYRRCGYGLEACEGILEYAREELEEPAVVCRITENNLPSRELAGRLRKNYPKLNIVVLPSQP